MNALNETHDTALKSLKCDAPGPETEGGHEDQRFTNPLNDTRNSEFIRDLTALESAVFVAEHYADDYRRPTGWQHLSAADNDQRVDAWRPGWALCAVLGPQVAVIDVDTKNGAVVDDIRKLLEEIGVRVYAEIRTPSGGAHFYVPGHVDLPNVSATADREGLQGLPGVEILSRNRNVFLPGTKRTKYAGRGYEIISNDLRTLAKNGDPRGGEALTEWVANNRWNREHRGPDAPQWDGTPPDDRQRAYLDAAIRSEVESLASMAPNSGRNNALNIAAVKLGGYVAGAGLDDDRVTNALIDASTRNGLAAEDGLEAVTATIKSGMNYGKQHPKAVPPPNSGPDGSGKSKSRTAAQVLADLALDKYRLGVSTDGEPFAVPVSGPKIVRMLRRGLRAELSNEYRLTTGKIAPQQALTEALLALEGEALASEPVHLCLRVGQQAGSIYLDLGDNTGAAIRINAGGWETVEDPPVLFRRSVLTSKLPRPTPDGQLDELWDLLNVAEADRPLIVANIIGMLYPDIPHPVLALIGEQGTGKSTAAKIISGLLDPSPVPIRKAPRDSESWITAASGSWVVALDNLSALSESLSDTLCRAVTGEGDVRRRLYSDDDLVVFSFRRCLILTGIDLGALRDDLADRTLLCDLERIPEHRRRRESQMMREWTEAHPRILGAILDLAVKVARILPSVTLETMPRMADYAVIQAAVDEVLGTAGLARYADRAASQATDAIAADPFLLALSKQLKEPIIGTASEILEKVESPERPPKGWPTSARHVTAVLRRNAPAMRRAGWTVDDLGRGGSSKSLRWEIAPPSRDPEKIMPATPAMPESRPLSGEIPNNPTGNVERTDSRNGQHGKYSRRSLDPTPVPEGRKIPETLGRAGDTGNTGNKNKRSRDNDPQQFGQIGRNDQR